MTNEGSFSRIRRLYSENSGSNGEEAYSEARSEENGDARVEDSRGVLLSRDIRESGGSDYNGEARKADSVKYSKELDDIAKSKEVKNIIQ